MFSATYQQRRESLPPPENQMFNARMFKTYGAILSLLAATTLALGTANLVLTSEAYCEPWYDEEPTYCSNTQEPYVWTWVASSIWASLPIFVAGLFGMSLSNDPARWMRIFALMIFLSSIVFAPAMIILSAIEVWRGSASTWNFYKLDSSLMEGNIMVEDSPYQAKFALPLVITILAGILFLMTGAITWALCCCMDNMGMSMEPAAPIVQPIYQPTPAVVQSGVYCPPRAQIVSGGDYLPTSGPNMATRYNSVLDPHNPGVMFGNFPSRGFNTGVNSYSEGGNPVYHFR